VLLQQTEQRLDQHGLVHSRDYKVRSPAVASCLTTELAGRIGRAVVLRETCSTPSKPSSGRDRGRLNHRTHMRVRQDHLRPAGRRLGYRANVHLGRSRHIEYRRHSPRGRPEVDAPRLTCLTGRWRIVDRAPIGWGIAIGGIGVPNADRPPVGCSLGHTAAFRLPRWLPSSPTSGGVYVTGWMRRQWPPWSAIGSSLTTGRWIRPCGWVSSRSRDLVRSWLPSAGSIADAETKQSGEMHSRRGLTHIGRCLRTGIDWSSSRQSGNRTS